MLHCYTTVPDIAKGWDTAYMFNTATFCILVSVPSQEPVIKWLLFVGALHICFSFIFVHK